MKLPSSCSQLRPTRPLIITVLIFIFAIILFGLHNSPASWASATTGRLDAEQLSSHALDDVRNSTLGFEHIFAINLPERTDHRDGLVLASSLSGLRFEFIDGVKGETVLGKTLPAYHNSNLNAGSIGSWRAHLNAIREVVHRDLASALIIEDDIDWDVRLKDLMQDMAVSSNAILEPGIHAAGDVKFDNLPTSFPSKSTPYGNGWDVLWLGHCGMNIPKERSHMVIHENDVSVPQPHYLKSWDINEVTPLISYPNHTRIVSRPQQATCSLAYAISQSGARQILYDIGLRRFDKPFDLMLRDWCEAEPRTHTCLGVLPQLFDHYRRDGSLDTDSDINTANDAVREERFTLNIRYSVRLNMKNLLRGESNFEDQYPNT